MKPSVSEQLKKFLQNNPNSQFSSGDLQRMIWTNKDGTIALPRTVVRRLQELAEDGTIQVTYEGDNTLYGANKAEIKIDPRLVMSRRMAEQLAAFD